MSCKTSKIVPVRKPLLIKTNGLKLIKSTLYKEDIIYESVKGDFLNLEHNCTILNKQSLITKVNITVARFEDSPVIKTSERIAGIIGQRNYETVFSAISSIFNHELKVQALFALLTIPKKTNTVSCQTEDNSNEEKKLVDSCCQTTESSMLTFNNKKLVKKRKVTPYVVTESVKKKEAKKVIVHPGPLLGLASKPDQPSGPTTDNVTDYTDKELPILSFDENSNESESKLSSITSISVNTIPGIYNDPLGIIDNVNKVTAPENKTTENKITVIDWSNSTTLTLLDGTVVRIPCKIEDDFHVATAETLQMVPMDLRKKLFCYQIYLDWKHALTRDEENYLPLHLAAINGDHDLVRRQCSVLRCRKESVDITTADGMTALQISIYRNQPMCTKILLFFGADPMVTDDDYRTCFHLAAEADPGHLRGLVKYCHWNPMKILKENEEMWKPELQSKPKDYLAKYLLRKISVMFDNQGYTPLMLASKLGKYENVRILAEAALDTINIQAPNSGNTALYIAVGSACVDANNRGNRSSVSDAFRKTIECLVELGADPAIENHSGSNVNTVLTDVQVGELSMIIANKMTAKNCNDTDANTTEACILVKDEDGNITKLPAKSRDDIDGNTNKARYLLRDDTGNIIDYRKLPTYKKTNKKVIQIEKPNRENPIYILPGLKIETPQNCRIEINTDNDAVVKKEQISPIPKKRYKYTQETPETSKKGAETDTHADYMAMFKNFITDVETAKIPSPLPVSETSKGSEITNRVSVVNFSDVQTVLITKSGRGSNSKILEEVKRTMKIDEMTQNNVMEDIVTLANDDSDMHPSID